MKKKYFMNLNIKKICSILHLFTVGVMVLLLSLSLVTNADASKKRDKNNSSLTTKAHFTKEELKKELEDLNYCRLIPRPQGLDKKLKLPAVDKKNQDKLAGKKVLLDINEIHYMQGGCSNTTKDGNYTVIQNAKDIKDGILDINVIPRIGVWKDTNGRIWTVDHRRLASFVLSGAVKKVPAVWIDSKTVIHDKFKYSNKAKGDKMTITSGRNGIVIERNSIKPDTNNDGDDDSDDTVGSETKCANNTSIIKNKNKFTKEELEKILQKLNYSELIKRQYGRDRQLKLPAIAKNQDKLAGKKVELDIDDIHYMQAGCSNTTKDGNYTVLQNAQDIQSGKLDINVIPRIGVWKDVNGNIWTVDHRRLASFVLSGAVKKVPAVWLDSKTVLHDKFKFSNKTKGDKMTVTAGRHGIVINRNSN
ncbi:MAG: hypothetical protein HQK49_16075 [Oligoflexia bacterium]|nr:hypothetical protein [Oligoflexia bacterium]